MNKMTYDEWCNKMHINIDISTDMDDDLRAYLFEEIKKLKRECYDYCMSKDDK